LHAEHARIFLILAVVLVLFGAKKLPELARGLGQGLKEFKKASRDMTDEIQASINEEPAAPARRIASESQPRRKPPCFGHVETPAAPMSNNADHFRSTPATAQRRIHPLPKWFNLDKRRV